MNPFSNGIRVEIPGNPELNSAIVAMPFDVALRPVSSDERVGEHNAVVWKFAYRTPISAMRRMFGVCTGPPNTSIVPYPTSSQASNKTFGAPSDASGARNGPQSGVESRMSSSILPLNFFAIEGPLIVRGTAPGSRQARKLTPGTYYTPTTTPQ